MSEDIEKDLRKSAFYGRWKEIGEAYTEMDGEDFMRWLNEFFDEHRMYGYENWAVRSTMCLEQYLKDGNSGVLK